MTATTTLGPHVRPAGLQTHGVLREEFTSEVDVVINEGVQREEEVHFVMLYHTHHHTG